MTARVERKGCYSKTYDVRGYAVLSKEMLKDEIEDYDYDDCPPYLLRLYFEGDDTCTFELDSEFSYSIKL